MPVSQENRGNQMGIHILKELVLKDTPHTHKKLHTTLCHLIRAPNRHNHALAPALGGAVTGCSPEEASDTVILVS